MVKGYGTFRSLFTEYNVHLVISIMILRENTNQMISLLPCLTVSLHGGKIGPGLIVANDLDELLIKKIISGGQTGADRAALDFAIAHRIPHGGWIPKGRKTEAGPLPATYHLQELNAGGYSQRTERNVLEADGTLIISQGKLIGGSALTRRLARKYKKPRLHIDLNGLSPAQAAIHIRKWIRKNFIQSLNIAGPRASEAPKIYQAVLRLLELTLNPEGCSHSG